MQNTTTINSHNGITLLEVLISVFIIGIGLIGVLALIPFGAYQVSKANNAEYAANMLVNAAADLKIRDLAKPASLAALNNGNNVNDDANNTVIQNGKLDCTKLFWVEANRMNILGLAEIMRGQDDFEFKVDEDTGANQPDFNNKKSTGRYTWFFTYRPADAVSGTPSNFSEVPFDQLTRSITVDLLGCYNRIATDDQELVNVVGYAPSLNGGTLTLESTADFEKLASTKYVFVKWQTNPALPAAQYAWCKVLFVDKASINAPKIIVTGLPNDFETKTNRQVYITNGILYHTQVEGVVIN